MTNELSLVFTMLRKELGNLPFHFISDLLPSLLLERTQSKYITTIHIYLLSTGGLKQTQVPHTAAAVHYIFNTWIPLLSHSLSHTHTAAAVHYILHT